MIGFKSFLKEHITVVNGRVTTTASNSRIKPSAGDIRTDNLENGKLYHKHVNGIDVYSVVNYITHPDATEILKTMKGQPSKYPLAGTGKPVDEVLDGSAKIIATKLRSLDVDTVIVAPSSGTLVNTMVNKIKKDAPNVKFITGAVSKKLFDADFDFSTLINDKHFAWDTLDVKSKKALLTSLKSKARDNDGSIPIKKIFKPHAKFVQGFMQIEDVIDDVLGKNVAVFDDVLSSGATFAEIARCVNELEPKYLVGFTFAKQTDKNRSGSDEE
jgi:hypothetical protein